jgi:hypothetical protein
MRWRSPRVASSAHRNGFGLRDDAPALALRGIAVTQRGDFAGEGSLAKLTMIASAIRSRRFGKLRVNI